MQGMGTMQEDLQLDFRLSRLTVQSLRNLCDARDVEGASNLLKDDLIQFCLQNIDQDVLEDFCAQQEEIYFVENMAKAIKWAANRKIVDLDPASSSEMANGVFTLRRSDGYEVYNVRFVNQTTEDIDTACECVDFREKGYFCPHQMSLLIRCLVDGLFELDQWTGPMTPEVEDLILANVFRKKRPKK